MTTKIDRRPMPRARRALIALALALATSGGPAAANETPDGFLYVPLRDGTTLHGLLQKATGPVGPTIVCMTPYTLTFAGSSSCGYRPSGYTQLVVQMRGGGCSGGDLDNFIYDQQDYYDVIEWAADQSWSNARVGVVGHSYPATLAWQAAASGAPSLDAVFLSAGWSDLYRDAVYPGGILRTGPGTKYNSGTTQLRTTNNVMPALQRGDIECAANQATRGAGTIMSISAATTVANPFDGPEWQRRSIYTKADQIDVPVFIATGYDDNHIGAHRGSFLMYELLTGPKKLFAVPGWHDQVFATGGRLGLGAEVDRWFARWLRDTPNGIEHEQTLTFHRTADPATPPLRLNEWPPPPSVVEWKEWFLGDGTLRETIPAAGASQTITTDRSVGFVGPPLTKSVEVAGPGVLTFWGSAATPDADWIADLVDVAPSGQQTLVRQGRLRSSLRGLHEDKTTFYRPWHRMTHPEPLIPDTPAEHRIELAPFGHTFGVGHRIAVYFRPADCAAARATGRAERGSCWPYGEGTEEVRSDNEGVAIIDSGTARIHVGPDMPTRLLMGVLDEGTSGGVDPTPPACPFDPGGLAASGTASVAGWARVSGPGGSQPPYAHVTVAARALGSQGDVSGAVNHHEIAQIAVPSRAHLTSTSLDRLRVGGGRALIEGVGVFDGEPEVAFCLEVSDKQAGAEVERVRLWTATGHHTPNGVVGSGDVIVSH